MIKNTYPISMQESMEYLKHSKDEGKEVKGFIKKFTKMSSEKAKEFRKKLKALEIIKLDEKSITKIIEIIPENQEELNKIFVGISLEDDESRKILDIITELK